jgi:hypothetical protein
MGVPRTAKFYAPAENATGIVDDVIVNADINSAAAIAFSKLAALADGRILVGSAANVATAVAMSGNATISNAGVVSVVGGAAAAAADFTVTAVATKDIVMKLGDAAGVSIFKVKDSANAIVFSVDSVGAVTIKGAVTMDTTDALTLDTINAISAKDLVITGADAKNVKVKLGDDDGGEAFVVEEVDGDDLFKVDSTGLATLVGGATLDNTTGTLLNISETGIRFTGKTAVVGSLSVPSSTQAGTVVGLTAAFGDPALLADGTVFVIKDSADGNKVKMVSVMGGAYYLGAEMPAAA